jgi:hypothetical protein
VAASLTDDTRSQGFAAAALALHLALNTGKLSEALPPSMHQVDDVFWVVARCTTVALAGVLVMRLRTLL